MKLYHITVLSNALSILSEGLIVNQRGTNRYGLDTGVDYEHIYESKAEAEKMKKPASIHLITDLAKAYFYKDFISECFNTRAEILVVDISDEKLIPDPEDSQGVYCLADIPASKITRLIENSPTMWKGEDNNNNHIDPKGGHHRRGPGNKIS